MLALICPLMFSLSPVRTLSRPDLRQVLAAGGSRGATAIGRGRGVLVVVQVALAVILLTVSSLALRSMREMYARRPAWRPRGCWCSAWSSTMCSIRRSTARAPRRSRRATALAALPGVESVAMVNALPILGDHGPITLDDRRRGGGAGRSAADGGRDRRVRTMPTARSASACWPEHGGPTAHAMWR